MSTGSPTILCLPFLSTFVSSGSPFLVYFFSGSPSCVSPGAASPHLLFLAQTWPCSPWSVGKLLAQRLWSSWLWAFYSEVELLQTPVILALQLKLWISLLFLFCVCFTINTYLPLSFTNLQKVHFYRHSLCLRIGSFTCWLRKLSSYSAMELSSPECLSCWKKNGENAFIKAVYDKVSINGRLKLCIQVFLHFCAEFNVFEDKQQKFSCLWNQQSLSKMSSFKALWRRANRRCKQGIKSAEVVLAKPSIHCVFNNETILS